MEHVADRHCLYAVLHAMLVWFYATDLGPSRRTTPSSSSFDISVRGRHSNPRSVALTLASPVVHVLTAVCALCACAVRWCSRHGAGQPPPPRPSVHHHRCVRCARRRCGRRVTLRVRVEGQGAGRPSPLPSPPHSSPLRSPPWPPPSWLLMAPSSASGGTSLPGALRQPSRAIIDACATCASRRTRSPGRCT